VTTTLSVTLANVVPPISEPLCHQGHACDAVPTRQEAAPAGHRAGRHADRVRPVWYSVCCPPCRRTFEVLHCGLTDPVAPLDVDSRLVPNQVIGPSCVRYALDTQLKVG